MRLLTSLLLPCLLLGQVTFQRTYGGTDWDDGRSVTQTADDGYIITGFTESYGAGNFDVWLIKTDAAGDTLWTRTFGGTCDDRGYSSAQTADGGYVTTGFTESFGVDDKNVWLIKTDPSGDTLWTRTFGGAPDDEGQSVAQTADSGYIIVGTTHSFGAGRGDVYLIKTDPAGDSLWTRTYGGAHDELGYSVIQTADGGYVITGHTRSFGLGQKDAWLIKTDASGDTMWTRTFGGTDIDHSYSVAQTRDGGYIVTGATYSFGAGNMDAWLVKTDSVGDTMWTRTFGGTSLDFALSGAPTEDGGFVMTGSTGGPGAGNWDVWLIRTDSLGDTLWTRTYGGAVPDCGYSVTPTQDGGYTIAGWTNSSGAGDKDVWLIKTDSLGRVGIAETPEPKRAETLGPTVLTKAQLQSELQIDPSVSLFDASGRTVRDPKIIPPGIYFVRRLTADSRQQTASRKVLVTD